MSVRTFDVFEGAETDACPSCGIHRKYAGYLKESCGDNFMGEGCFVEWRSGAHPGTGALPDGCVIDEEDER